MHAYHANDPPEAQDNQLHEPNEAHKRIRPGGGIGRHDLYK